MTYDPTKNREARIAAIRARRGTPERQATIEAVTQAKAAAAESIAKLNAEDKAWNRKFNRADLRTQALMLAELDLISPALNDALRAVASSIPAGVR